MASSVSVSAEGLKVSQKSGNTSRNAKIGPSGGSIGITRGPVQISVNQKGTISGKIDVGVASIGVDSKGGMSVGIGGFGISYNQDGSGEISSPFGIAKMEVEKKGCTYIKRTYLAGTLIDTEYQQIEGCQEDPPVPPDPDTPRHTPPPVNYPSPVSPNPMPNVDPNASVVVVLGWQYAYYGDYIWQQNYPHYRNYGYYPNGYTYRRFQESTFTTTFSSFSLEKIKKNLSDGRGPNSATTYGLCNLTGFMREKEEWGPEFNGNSYDIRLNFWRKSDDNGVLTSGGEYDQDVFSDPYLDDKRPGSAGIGLEIITNRGIWGQIQQRWQEGGGLYNETSYINNDYTTSTNIELVKGMSSSCISILCVIDLTNNKIHTPPPNLPIEYPPPPPPIMSNCCKENKVDLARLEEAIERLEQVIGTREILNDAQGYAVPNKMLIPGGEGYSFSKNYLNIFTWLFAAIDRYGFDGPIVVDVADVDKGKAGNQSLQMQVNSLSTAIQTLLSLAVENKGDQATRLNIQIRLAFMLTRLMRMMHKMYYLVVAILEGLGIPTIKKYIKNIPFEFNLNPEDLGFGKKAEQLDTMNEDELEAQLPKILDTKEMDLIVEQFKPNQLDLRGFLLKLINKK